MGRNNLERLSPEERMKQAAAGLRFAEMIAKLGFEEQEKFAHDLGQYVYIGQNKPYDDSTISAIIKGKMAIPLKVKMALSANYKINTSWLETGEGEMFLDNVDKRPAIESLSNHGFAEFYDDVDEAMQRRHDREARGYVLNRIEAFSARQFADFYANKYSDLELTPDTIQKTMDNFKMAALAFYGELKNN